MDESEKIKRRYELLKIARELLIEEYINKRAEEHNRWVAENDEMWKIKRKNLPYPPFTPYPTDEEIVKVASNFYNFIYGSEEKNLDNILDIKNNSDNNSAIIESIDNTEDTTKVVADEAVKENDVTKNSNFLPGWMRRTK